MFNKIKHLKDLRSQAKTMQDALAEEKITKENGGLVLTMDGNQEVVEFRIQDEALLSPENKEKLEKATHELINDTAKETKQLMARKVQEMGGLSGLGL
jgi:DNA-binding protein YbaB